MYITDNKNYEKTWLFKQNSFKCMEFWEYQFTVFDCKLYIDLLLYNYTLYN